MADQSVLETLFDIVCCHIEVLSIVAQVEACHATPHPGLGLEEAFLATIPYQVHLRLLLLILWVGNRSEDTSLRVVSQTNLIIRQEVYCVRHTTIGAISVRPSTCFGRLRHIFIIHDKCIHINQVDVHRLGFLLLLLRKGVIFTLILGQTYTVAKEIIKTWNWRIWIRCFHF